MNKQEIDVYPKMFIDYYTDRGFLEENSKDVKKERLYFSNEYYGARISQTFPVIDQSGTWVNKTYQYNIYVGEEIDIYDVVYRPKQYLTGYDDIREFEMVYHNLNIKRLVLLPKHSRVIMLSEDDKICGTQEELELLLQAIAQVYMPLNVSFEEKLYQNFAGIKRKYYALNNKG